MNSSVALAADAGRLSAPLSRDARTVCHLLESLQGGRLQLRLPDGAELLFGEGESLVHWTVHSHDVFSRILARGDLGLAESYLDGDWEASDLTAFLTLLARNRANLGQAIYGAWPRLLLSRLRHILNGNTRRGSQRNIMAHYDLGNEFYRRWLDPSMSYSSALFEAGNRTLEQAQQAKYARILSRLQPQTGADVLEIGCGWGGFAEVACQQGLKVSGITLSPAQLAYAQARVPQAALTLQDYRDLQGSYDHIVSIEMFEAVGERWWPTYFETLARCLKRDGRAMVQSITIDEALFPTYRKGTDFIQQYIFPGGMLPSRTAFRNTAARAGLKVTDEFAFGLDYARTLALWRSRFEQEWMAIANLGFDETFYRLWRLYLSYCEAGFLAGNVSVVQFELTHANT